MLTWPYSLTVSRPTIPRSRSPDNNFLTMSLGLWNQTSKLESYKIRKLIYDHSTAMTCQTASYSYQSNMMVTTQPITPSNSQTLNIEEDITTKTTEVNSTTIICGNRLRSTITSYLGLYQKPSKKYIIITDHSTWCRLLMICGIADWAIVHKQTLMNYS